MNYDTMVLNKLLDKYERSFHFKENAVSNKRILLTCDEKTLHIDYSKTDVFQDFLRCVRELEKNGYVEIISWTRQDYIIDKLCLVIENVDSVYEYLKRPHKRTNLNAVINELKVSLSTIQNEWILSFLYKACENMSDKESLVGIWKNDLTVIQNLLKALCKIDKLGSKAISMRAFSVSLYSDSKYFERNIKSIIIPIIKSNEPSLIDAEDIEDREVLAQVGIIMMPEIFEFCGNISIKFRDGTVDFSPIKKGACISSDCIDDIRKIQFYRINRIIFIENKTNYSEYNLTCNDENTLIIYHGGFYSPSKEKFFKKIYESAENISFYFWGDIDFGGFNMFERLKKNIIPTLLPLNMGVSEYLKYLNFGVCKGDAYLNKVKKLLEINSFLEFHTVIKHIIEYGKIVEQECFLTSFE